MVVSLDSPLIVASLDLEFYHDYVIKYSSWFLCQVLDNMLQTYVRSTLVVVGFCWLVNFTYNNMYHSSVEMTPLMLVRDDVEVFNRLIWGWRWEILMGWWDSVRRECEKSIPSNLTFQILLYIYFTQVFPSWSLGDERW